MFSINCLEITASKSQWRKNKPLYKNLLARKDYKKYKKETGSVKGFRKRFFFNDYYKHTQYGVLEKNPDRALPENFFGNNINVQAIVGKNGSGKSTLMDLMYMAINNFCYMFERGNKMPPPQKISIVPSKSTVSYDTTDLLFVKNLFSKLYFSINNNVHILSCEGDVIKLDETLFEIDKNPHGYEDKDERFKGIPNELLPIKLKDFFYTIVSNYSMQSFISSNYTCDAYVHQNKFDGNQWDCEFNGCWIDHIFHKNDGYKKSIVLNPFRKDGNINMEAELTLSKDRFIALAVKNKNIDDIYSLDKIRYFNQEKKLIQIKTNLNRLFHRTAFFKDPLNDFDNVLKNKKFASLMHFFNFNISNKSPKEKKLCLIYLSEKINKIISTYPKYSEYIAYHPKEFWWKRKNSEINKLLHSISDGKSHIELKAQRAINFLKLDDNIIQSLLATKTFDIEDYLKVFSSYSPNSNLDYIIEHLPPSIFDKEITLKNKKNNSIVNYKQLSSGEHQKHQTISTHLYHLTNLISVQKSNETSTKKTLAYKYVNLVFDEIEICFHPEYQRSMINTLLQMLIARKMNINCTINIFVVTHSPFILSDIPASNILFLEDGTQEVSKNKKTLTFAQNIGEMMYDSFFMKKTIGDFAETKLKELIKRKQGKNSSMSKKEADDILNIIGDPVIRSMIEEIEKIEVSDD